MTTATSELLTTGDAARILGVSADSVRVYERAGRLAATRTAGGVRLFTREDVERLAGERAGREKGGRDG